MRDLTQEQKEKNKEDMRYAQRFAIERVDSLARDYPRVISLFSAEINQLKQLLKSICATSDSLRGYKSATDTFYKFIDKVIALAEVLDRKKISDDYLKDELISLINYVDPYAIAPQKRVSSLVESLDPFADAVLQASGQSYSEIRTSLFIKNVKEAILDYRTSTSCAGGGCAFFTLEAKADKVCVAQLEKLLKSGKSADVALQQKMHMIISDYMANSKNLKNILHVVFETAGFGKLEVLMVRLLPDHPPVLQQETSLEDEDFTL